MTSVDRYESVREQIDNVPYRSVSNLQKVCIQGQKTRVINGPAVTRAVGSGSEISRV